MRSLTAVVYTVTLQILLDRVIKSNFYEYLVSNFLLFYHTCVIIFIIFKYDFQNEKLEAGPTPPDLSKLNLLSLNTPVVFDSSGWFWNFGDVSQQPSKTVVIGDTVSAKFVSITYLKYGVFLNVLSSVQIISF